MNRRGFLKTSAATVLPAVFSGSNSNALIVKKKASTPLTGAYYLNANMYTIVPDHVKSDMQWMAERGTHFVCIGILEQDLWAANENIGLLVDEVEKQGMKAMAVPSRWAGLTAGAPKVPSMFSVLNPHTWVLDENNNAGFAPLTSGVISSIHWPETYEFFTATIKDLYQKHPRFAGLIIDEPKGFHVDHSSKAIEVLGRDASPGEHYRAAARFYGDVCGYVKKHFPDKLTMMFNQTHLSDEILVTSANTRNLDYFGGDGRPWDIKTDARWDDGSKGQDFGKRKVLLDGRGEKIINLAKAGKRKSFLLIENHNLSREMIEPMDHFYPQVLDLGADLYLYYYYPRNVEEPEQAMKVIGKHLKYHLRG